MKRIEGAIEVNDITYTHTHTRTHTRTHTHTYIHTHTHTNGDFFHTPSSHIVARSNAFNYLHPPFAAI